MLLKKIAVFFISIPATVPLVAHLYKKGKNEKVAISDNLGMNKYSERMSWLKNCRPFSDSEETIFVCPRNFGEKSPAFYHYRIDYRGNKVNNDFFVYARKVESISYKQQENLVVANLLNGDEAIVKEFPKEFEELKRDWSIDPSKSCRIDGNSLEGKTRRLSCKFLEDGLYRYISLSE